jgi:hypothetical protein
MTPNEARTEVSNLATALLRAGLAVNINTPTMHNMGQNWSVTWPAAMAATGVLSDLPFASIIEYRRFILGNHYIALLVDGALLQISIDIRNNEVVGHRMCFYPCPILLPADFEILSFDDFDSLLIQEFESHTEAIASDSDPQVVNLRLRTPLRFDFAPDAAGPAEPASHVHLSDAATRLAVHAPLSVGHFVQFIFKHFYPEVWQDAALENLSRWPLRQMKRCVSTNDELILYLNCRHQIAAAGAGQNA